MKLKNEPLFLGTFLCLLFPIGFILLIKSDLNKRTKLLLGSTCACLFLLLLSSTLLFPPNSSETEKFDVVITRPELSVGQSGGLAVTDGENYITAFNLVSDSAILDVHDSVYTAMMPGTGTLTVQHNGKEQSIQIHVTNGKATDKTVYASASGERYHKNQSHSGKRGVSMTEEEALQSNKTPCKICYRNRQ